jgi:hypothetical protein
MYSNFFLKFLNGNQIIYLDGYSKEMLNFEDTFLIFL